MRKKTSSVKYPKCACEVNKYDYFRREYRNGRHHLFRQCPKCGEVAQSPMKPDEYDRNGILNPSLLRKREI